MKVLKNKLKKVNIIKRMFYFLAIFLYIISYGLFIYSLSKLGNVEKTLRYIFIIFFGIWFLIYLLSGLLTMIAKKKKTYILITIITYIFLCGFATISYIINKEYGLIEEMNKEKLLYTTNLISLKETTFNDGLSIGMIESESDIEGNILAKKLIEKENLSNKIQTYEDYHSMITDLYKGKIGACFVSSNYAINFANESFENLKEGETGLPIEEKVKVLFEYSEEMDNQDNQILKTSKTKKLTEPFTVLVMGVDSTINGLKANQAFNGDTLIMVTFNPTTLTATMFSIPRDMYVPIACNHDRYAKINSSAAYGSSCVINTVQKLTNIDIDYYVKINFIGVVDLVEALGGVEVYVEEPDFDNNFGIKCGIGSNGQVRVCEQNSLRQIGNDTVYMDSGLQVLNGEQALAYARNRHQYAISDIARNQHQQDVIVAMAQKLRTITSISDFQNILNTISNNIETNMTPEQILSFYDVGKNMLANSTGNAISVKKTYLSYYSLPVWLPNSDMYTSALGYYPQSLEAITDLMKVNLGKQESKEKTIKTFNISYNEEYSTPLVGFGLNGGAKLQTVKNLIGSSRFDASSWCNQTDLSCSFEEITDSAPEGIIVRQSQHEGVLVNSIGSIKFYVSDGKGSSSTEKPNDNEDEEETALPSFIGKTETYTKTWCDNNDIKCNFEKASSKEKKGTIIHQSVIKGTSINKITTITFKVSEGPTNNNDDDDDDNDENDDPSEPDTPNDPNPSEDDDPTDVIPGSPGESNNTTNN